MYFVREDILKGDVVLESVMHMGIEVAAMIVKKRESANMARVIILD